MRLTIDFETRSACDIKKAGAWRYSEDPSTEVICCAVKADDDLTAIWFPKWSWDLLPEDHDLPILADHELFTLLRTAETIEAHNAEFEVSEWQNVCVPKYGWPEVPYDKIRCSLAKCSYHALPRGLGDACKALGLGVQKDDEGKKLMLKMCKPRKPTKTDPSVWNQRPEQLVRLAQYCMVDVEAEHGLSQALPDLPPLELRVWQLDQRINRRGIYADLPMAAKMLAEVGVLERAAEVQAAGLTGGAVRTVKQVSAGLRWLAGFGVHMESLDRSSVAEALSRKNLPEPAREFLQLRKEMGKSSTAKYASILACAGADSRIRGTLMYHGASTGRWSGRTIQPQNFPRGAFSDLDACLEATMAGGLEFAQVLWGDPMTAASTCLRGILRAAPGKELVCADFSSIEARVTAWVAGEEHVLEAFRSGQDLYKVAAAGIFGCDYADVSKTQRQVGKCAVLALGYQGGIGAFVAMAKNYGIDLESLPDVVFPSAMPDDIEASRGIAKAYLAEHKGAMSEDAATACDLIKRLWRAAHPNITRLWKALENAALAAVRSPGEVVVYRDVAFRTQGRFLQMRLPSGRKLHYHAPAVLTVTTRWGEDKEMVTAESVNSMTKKWERRPYYGGILTENLVQAISRDLMALAMLRVEAAGYPVVLSVHDELVSEVPEGFGTLEEYERLMSMTPAWAAGLPVSAEGWRGVRYRK